MDVLYVVMMWGRRPDKNCSAGCYCFSLLSVRREGVISFTLSFFYPKVNNTALVDGGQVCTLGLWMTKILVVPIINYQHKHCCRKGAFERCPCGLRPRSTACCLGQQNNTNQRAISLCSYSLSLKKEQSLASHTLNSLLGLWTEWTSFCLRTSVRAI